MSTLLATEIERILRAQGKKKSQLAKQAGITPAMLSRIITGSVSPTNETLHKIGGALNMKPDRLIKLRDRDRSDTPGMRVGIAHSLWSAPALAVAIEERLSDVQFASFGSGSALPGSSTAPQFFSRHTDRVVPCGPPLGRANERFQGSSSLPPPDPLQDLSDAYKPYTAKDLCELLWDDQIDCLVAAGSIHHLIEHKAVRCAEILHIFGGIVPLLLLPSGEAGEGGSSWNWETLDRIIRDYLSPKDESHQLHVYYSENTAAEVQYHAFRRLIEFTRDKRDDVIVVHPVDLGRWGDVKQSLTQLIEERNKDCFLFLMWEPHASWLSKHASTFSTHALWEGRQQDLSYKIGKVFPSQQPFKGAYLEFAVYIRRESVSKCWMNGHIDRFLASLRAKVKLLSGEIPLDQSSPTISRLAAYLDMPIDRCLSGLAQMNFAIRYYPEWEEFLSPMKGDLNL